MSAEILREAAALMRSRAEAATPDYAPMPARIDIWQDGTCDGCAEYAHLVASYPDPDSEPWLCGDCAAQADYEGSWSPDVALAVADWLDEVEGWMEEGVGLLPETNIGDAWIEMRRRAIDVARAYLGSQP